MVRGSGFIHTALAVCIVVLRTTVALAQSPPAATSIDVFGSKLFLGVVPVRDADSDLTKALIARQKPSLGAALENLSTCAAKPECRAAVDRCRSALRSLVVRSYPSTSGLHARITTVESAGNCTSALRFAVLRVAEAGDKAVLARAALLDPTIADLEPNETYAIYGRWDDVDGEMIRVGTGIIPDGLTTLRRQLASGEPLFDARWVRGSFDLDLRGAPELVADLGAELGAAPAARHLWLELAGRRWPFAFVDHRSVAIPSELVRREMVRLHGVHGDAFVPSAREWETMLARIDMCITASYRVPAVGVVLPRPTCHPLRRLVAWTAPPAADLMIAVAELDVLLARRSKLASAIPLERLGPVLTIGSMVSARKRWRQHEGGGLVLCDERGCESLSAPRLLRTSGMAEVRWAPSTQVADQVRAISLARVVVIDPITDWQRQDRRSAWSAAPKLFGLVGHARRRGATASRVVLPASPMLPGAREIALTSAPNHGLATVATRDGRCPSTVNGIEPEALLVDQPYELHLVSIGSDGEVTCLARAGHIVHEQRIAARNGAARLVVLGDSLLAGDGRHRAAVLMAPVVSAIVPVGGHAVSETSLGATVRFDATEVDHVGGAAWSSVQWGPAGAPRLFVAGVSIDSAWETKIGIYAGLNVGVLFDLLGGR